MEKYKQKISKFNKMLDIFNKDNLNINKIISRLPIKKQLNIIAILNIIIMLIITSVFYSQIKYIYKERNSKYMDEITTQIANTITSNCNIINNLLHTIAYNNIIQEYLMETDQSVKFQLYENVSNLLENMKIINKGIIDIVLIGNNGNTIDTYGGAHFCKQIINRIPEKGGPYYSDIIKFEGLFVKRDCFFVGIEVYSFNPNKNPNSLIGTLFIVVDSNSLLGENNMDIKKIGAEIYCLDRNDNIFFGKTDDKSKNILGMVNDYYSSSYLGMESNKDSSYNIEIFGQNYIFKVVQLPYIEGKIIGIIPQKELMKEIVRAREVQIIVSIVGIGILSIFFAMVNNNIVQPIKKLVEFMKSINTENLKMKVDLEGYNEISTMAHEFNIMLDKIEKLTQELMESNTRLYELELSKKQCEIAYLRSQINPHFLYNTLEAFKGIAAEENVPKIMEMSKALAMIFRYSIKGDDIVPLREELKIIKAYLSIQQIRFANRFEVIYEIDENIMDCRVPRMILQPIVENAVSHGLESKMDKGHLIIGAKSYGDNVMYIWVKDDGVGMDQDMFNKIHRKLSEYKIRNNNDEAKTLNSDFNEGIGLVNVNNRIKLAYGEEYGITIYSSPGMGTEVIIKLPVA